MFSFFKRLKSENSVESQNPRRQFAQLLDKELRKRGLTDPLRFDEEAFSLSTDQAKGHIIYLSNAFAEYEKADTPNAKARVIDHTGLAHYDAFVQSGQNFDSVRDNLILTVREKCFFEFTKLHGQIDNFNTPTVETREFTENLVICIAIDYSNRMTYATREDLSRWNISFDEAYQLAYRNLFEATGSFEEIQPGLYQGPWNDCYVPSRLLFVELIRALPVKGQPVAIAANRNTLIVTGSEDIDGQKLMLNMTREALKDPRPMSPRPLILKEGEWLNYFPQHDTPLFDDYAAFRVETFGQDYAEQKALLEKLYEKRGEDIFVASYSSMEDKETKKIESFCVWSRDVLTVLPQTDLVIFYDHKKPEKERKVCTARWEDVQGTVGALMQPQGLYPERYKVESFPDAQALQKMHYPSTV